MIWEAKGSGFNIGMCRSGLEFKKKWVIGDGGEFWDSEGVIKLKRVKTVNVED